MTLQKWIERGGAMEYLTFILLVFGSIVIGLVIGKWYDRLKVRFNNDHAGLLLLVILPLLTAPVAFFTLSAHLAMIVTGVVLWGIIMATHETIMKAGIADITSIRKRGTGYGIFNTVYGLGIFIGSTAAGFLYDYSINLLIILMFSVQLVAAPVFLVMRRNVHASGNQ